MCQGLGPNKQDDILEVDRKGLHVQYIHYTYIYIYIYVHVYIYIYKYSIV